MVPGSGICVIANLDCQLHMPGKREPQLRNCFYQIDPLVCLWVIFLTADCVRTQPNKRSAISVQVDLGCMRKAAEPLNGSRECARKQCFPGVSGSAPCQVPAWFRSLTSLNKGLCAVKVSQRNSFFAHIGYFVIATKKNKQAGTRGSEVICCWP